MGASCGVNELAPLTFQSPRGARAGSVITGPVAVTMSARGTRLWASWLPPTGVPGGQSPQVRDGALEGTWRRGEGREEVTPVSGAAPVSGLPRIVPPRTRLARAGERGVKAHKDPAETRTRTLQSTLCPESWQIPRQPERRSARELLELLLAQPGAEPRFCRHSAV